MKNKTTKTIACVIAGLTLIACEKRGGNFSSTTFVVPADIAARLATEESNETIARDYLARIDFDIGNNKLYAVSLTGSGDSGFTEQDGAFLIQAHNPNGGTGHAFVGTFGTNNGIPNVGAPLSANATFNGIYAFIITGTGNSNIYSGKIQLKADFEDGELFGQTQFNRNNRIGLRENEFTVLGDFNGNTLSGSVSYGGGGIFGGYHFADLSGFIGVNGAVGVFARSVDIGADGKDTPPGPRQVIDHTFSGGFIVD